MIRKYYHQLIATKLVALRYMVVGGLNTLFGFSFFPVFYWLFNHAISVNLLVTLSHLCCTVFAFVTHKYFTFQSEGKIHLEGSKFLLIQTVGWIVNLVLLNLAMAVIPWTAFALQMLISLLLTVANYFVYKYIIFKPRQP